MGEEGLREKVRRMLPYADAVTMRIIYRILLRRVDLSAVFGGGK